MKCLWAVGCAFLITTTARADDWPQWLGPQRDGVWRETSIVDSLSGQPKQVWRTKIGAGYAGPAVAGDRVYVTDRVLDPGARNPASGFGRGEIPGKERVHALDRSTGAIVWTHEYECKYSIGYGSGPRCTPTISAGRVYTLGAMGMLKCLNAANGKVVWEHDLRKEYGAPPQIWGFSGHPLLDGERLICLVGGKATVVAFHKDTGKEIWQAMDESSAGYCPPVIYQVGDTRQLIIWHPQAVNGLDPVNGKVLWSVPFKLHQSGLSIPMPRLDGDMLFVTSFYNGPLMLKLDPKSPAAATLWKGKTNSEKAERTDGLHSIMPTPVIKDGHIYGVCSYGQLRCLKEATGERVWETMRATRPMKDGQLVPSESTKPTEKDRWGNAFLTPQSDRMWIFNEQGDLILAKLTPAGYEELGRQHLIKPDNMMAGRPVVWSHPAYAGKCVFVRSDAEIVCVDLAKE